MNPKTQLISALRALATVRPDILIEAARRAGYTRAPTLGATSAGEIVATAEADNGFLDQLASILPAILSYRQADKLMDINLERARLGLPPISGEQLAPTVNVGVSSGITNLAFIALAILGFYVLTKAVK